MTSAMTAAGNAPVRGNPTATETVVALAATGVGLAVLVPAVAGLTSAGLRPLLLVLGLVALTALVARHYARRQNDEFLVRLVTVGLIFKLAACLLYVAVVTNAYGGIADAFHYSGLATNMADQLRQGVIDLSRENLGGYPFQGSGFIILVIAVLYVLVGNSQLAVAFLFALASFWGQYLFYRAFRVAYPAGDSRRYGWLVFLFPSAVFWTAAIGKDAWIVLFLGIVSLGAARVFTRQTGGYRLLVVGLPGLLVVRPHVGAMFVAALAAGFLGRAPNPVRRRPLGWLVGTAVVVAMGAATFQAIERFIQRDEDQGNIAEAFEATAQRSALGGSEFQPTRVSSVWDVPQAAATVLFRPYPHEARNATMLVASLEGLGLLGLLVVSAGRLRRLPAALLRVSYVRLAATFTVLFVVAFSYISNLGILARQRVQVLPFLFVLVAISSRRSDAAGAGSAAPPWRRP